MIKLILIYLIIQLLSTLYGVSVIKSVKPIVNKKLDDDGYILKNKNSMYKFNEKLEKILKGFIPFYYATKAINLIKDGNAVEKQYNKEIEDGNYITRNEYEEELARFELAKNLVHVKVNNEPSIMFEKPEKYVARKNDYNLLETNEEEVVYNEIKETREENLSITPFKPIKTEIALDKEIDKKEVVKAIMDLDSDELDLLEQRIRELSNIKRKNKSLILDVA